MYINIKTKELITRNDLKARYNASVPINAEKLSFGEDTYALVHQGDKANNEYQTITAGDVIEVDGVWTQTYIVQDLPEEAKISVIERELTRKVQEELDRFAQEKGYDNIMSACSYSNSTDSKYKAEAEYCMALRDNTWRALSEVLDEIKSGDRVVAGWEEVYYGLAIAHARWNDLDQVEDEAYKVVARSVSAAMK